MAKSKSPSIWHTLSTDKNLKMRIALGFSAAINLWFIVAEFVNGALQWSLWSRSLGVYYLLLITLKVFLIVRSRRGMSAAQEATTARAVGIVLLVLNMVLIGMFVQMVVRNNAPKYIEVILAAIVVFALYRIIAVGVSMVRFRGVKRPTWLAIKAINLVAGLVALLMVQRTLIAMIIGEAEIARILNSAGGLVVFSVVLWIAIWLIRGKDWRRR